MIFAPMQTGAGGLRPGWGRRVTDRLSSSATRAFPPHPGLGASSEAGGRGLTATPESPPGGRRSRGSGRCPCGAAGSGQQTSRPAAQGAGRRVWEPRGCPPQRTSLHLALNRRPHLRRHLFHRFLRLSPASVFRSGILFLPSLPSSVHFPLQLACSSLARSLPHSLRPRHSTE